MKYSILMLVLLLMASLACNLSANNSKDPTPIALNGGGVVNIPTTVATATATVTPSPTATTTSNTDNGGSGNQGSNCTIRTDWPTYAVQSGDTLSLIAARSNTTTAALVTANCLSNANLLEIGQILRVPQIPIQVPQIGPLQVSPANVLGSGAGITYLVVQGATVNLNANVDAADYVNFYVLSPASSAPAQLIGTDYNLRDGGHMQWTAPQQGIGNIKMWAEAVYAGNQTVRTAEVLVRWEPDISNQPQLGGLSISPSTVSEYGEIYVDAGQNVTLTIPAINAVRVDYFTAPTGTGMTGTQIGVDNSPSNGVSSIQWTTPSGDGAMHIWAEATGSNDTVTTGEIRMLIWSTPCINDWFFTFSEQAPAFACPTAVQSVAVIAQDFEGGRVFRYPIATTDSNVYYFVVYNDGRWESFVDAWDGSPIDNSDFTPPADREVPAGGMGYLWRNNDNLRANLGWAYGPQEEILGRYQQIEGSAESLAFPAQFPGWTIYIDYGKSGLVLRLTVQSAGNGGSRWETVGGYE